MKSALCAMGCAAALAAAGAANALTTTYITNFDKDNNIYTNLNEQFPNTGAGVPGSEVGTANASFFFNPSTYPTNPNNLNYVGDNGVSFQLTSDAVGHDFAQVGSGIGYDSLNLPINVSSAENVYLLAGAYDGTSFNITFSGTGGVSETFSSIFLPDFNGGSINSTSPTLSDQTVYRVQDIGAGGSGNSVTGGYNNYSLTEVGFTLGPQFDGQTLQQATITSNGYETLILGATVSSAGVPEPASWALMIAGMGGVGFVLRRARKLAGRQIGGVLTA
jgi:hypothetical protein